jgi:membrane-bound ClpP family serine protease
MIWFIIIALLLIGLVLLVVEVVFIPGTTVVGILGIVFSIIGVVLSYNHFGNGVGFYILLTTLGGTLVALFFSFRAGAWNKFSLKSSIKGKVNEGTQSHLRVGDVGETVSALRPSGKAVFGESIFEVRSTGSYAEPKSKVRIIQIESNQIVVELIN